MSLSEIKEILHKIDIRPGEVSYSKTLERGSDCQLTRPNILTAIFLMAQMRVEKRLHELRAQIFRYRNAVGI